ncbi:hypothetical protein COCOR_05951 [Corallococcus coralloides DSM 2259]|uniref:OTU domain-containing protein n=1 Tax=Corallococcus coralloides (strain ATCC 25202 / DSM 2259 / NBRC 100086 / M2) TaxID=1144275 RepID=H8MJL7_CORCM|nr:hypothetical protein [Corallococcus coralloides]AFE06669.1 hypothetical protein COCOR_05951 [Corallococcus coralloides DSM 2259]
MPGFAEHVVGSPDALARLRKAYLSDVTEGGTWGAEVEARHLAQAFGVRIVFWCESATGKFRLAHQYNHGGTTLHILCRGSHFEALRAPPTEGNPFNRASVVTNSGGGDCLYRAFHQAYLRHDNEPNAKALRFYRTLVAQRMRKEPELDLEGLLVTLLDEVEMLGFALGAGPTLQDEMRKLYREFRRRPVEGGGSIPPTGRVEDPGVGLGDRDPVPRKEMTVAERMLDRIGRLIATEASVHVAAALDDSVLVMSANDDTVNVLAALRTLLNDYQGGGALSDPFSGVRTGQRRVPTDQLVTFNKTSGTTTKARRVVDLEKIAALRSGQLEALTSGTTKTRLQRLKAALTAGLLTDNVRQTAEQQYLAGAVGIYFIPHVPRTPDTGVVHGEMNVTAAIQTRRAGKRLTDDVFIGGTLIDCFDCNKAHKARNESLRKAGERWHFYSGGTHGNSFPNWYLPDDSRRNIDDDTFSRGRFPGGVPRIEWWDTSRGGQYGYFAQRDVIQYYFMRGRTPVDTNRRYAPRGGGENPYYLRRENYTIWESTPRSYLTELFLRDKLYKHINKAHSSFADDSDSDAEDYDELIVKRTEKKKAQLLKLRRSYAESNPELSFITDPELSLPFSYEQVRTDPLMGGVLVLYSGPAPRNPRPEFFISPELLERIWMPESMRPSSSRQEPFVRGVELPRQRPVPRIGWSGGQGPQAMPRERSAPRGPSRDELRRLLWAVEVLPVELGGNPQPLAVPGQERLSFNLGLLFEFFQLLAVSLGVQEVLLDLPLEEVLDGLVGALFEAGLRRTMPDEQWLALAGVAVFLKYVLVLTRLGTRTTLDLLQDLQGPALRELGM